MTAQRQQLDRAQAAFEQAGGDTTGRWVRFDRDTEAQLEQLKDAVDRRSQSEILAWLELLELHLEIGPDKGLSPAQVRRRAAEALAELEEAFDEEHLAQPGRVWRPGRRAGDEVRVNLDVEDVPLAEVARQLSRQAGRNIVAPHVEETVSVSLRDIAWSEALQVVADMTRCTIEAGPGDVLILQQPPRVTVQFTDANLRTVLKLVAAYSGKNVLIGAKVRGPTTVNLKEVPWRDALEGLAVGAGLDLQERGEVITITRLEETALSATQKARFAALRRRANELSGIPLQAQTVAPVDGQGEVPLLSDIPVIGDLMGGRREQPAGHPAQTAVVQDDEAPAQEAEPEPQIDVPPQEFEADEEQPRRGVQYRQPHSDEPQQPEWPQGGAPPGADPPSP